MNYFVFFRNNWKILLFAVMLTFFSGFGQTFLLSLYIPSLIDDFKISQSTFSTIYASATLCSGLIIVFAGKLIDRFPLLKFSLVVVTGFILAHVVAGLSLNLPMLFLAFFMLRFFGQGLLSHTAIISMGKYFSQARGKALSIAYLGYPLAEAIIPVSVIVLIMAVGWRESFLLSAAFVAVILTPLVWLILKDFNKSQIKETREHKTVYEPKPESTKVWGQRDIVRNLNFYIYAPTVFIVGFTLTSLFFFQTFIAQSKGWSLEWMAFSISAYAIGSSVFSILTGPLIDKFTARKVYPFVLIPMAIGLMVLTTFQHPVSAFIFWFFIGVTAGANPTTGNALYAETYGVTNLGSVRSIFTFIMIASTAAGPVLYSFLLDAGLSFNHIHFGLLTVILLNIIFVNLGFAHQKRKVVID